jgi:transcriptional regulator with XRE-family HTH domain
VAQLARFLENDPRVLFPRRVREVRTQAGLTQQQLAERMSLVFKMHRSAIAKIEAGDRPVLLGEAIAIAQILGVDLQELITDPDYRAGRPDRQRLAAQLEVRSLEREAGEQLQHLETARALAANTQERLDAARRRLAELEE